jgi:hypothetical protein
MFNFNLSTVLTYNLEKNISPLFYYKNDEFIKEFLIYFNKQSQDIINYIDILNNAKLEFLIRNRYSILYYMLPLNLNFTEFKTKWIQHYEYSDNIELKLSRYGILKDHFDINILLYDWMIYKYFKKFYNNHKLNYFQLYKNNELINNMKISKLIRIINFRQPSIIFLQNIDEYDAYVSIGKNINYTIYWINNMAILINNLTREFLYSIKININNLDIDNFDFEPFLIILENYDIILISGFILDMVNYLELIEKYKYNSKKIIIGITTAIDITEEKYDLYDFKISNYLPTTYLYKSAIHPLYTNLNESSGQYDFILTNFVIDDIKLYYNESTSNFNIDHYPLEITLKEK